jgi:hypothetical protein
LPTPAPAWRAAISQVGKGNHKVTTPAFFRNQS